MSHNHNNHQDTPQDFVSIIKIVKWTFLPYLGFQFIHFLVVLGRSPENLLNTLIFFIELSGWGYLIVGGPFVLIGVTINYFMNQTMIASIPQESTLYEAITHTTMMVGNLKLILPDLEEESEILEITEMEED